MTAFESSHKSLLMGVSQQVPEERLPGQLTAQLNMLSDPVTNLRRRPGLQFSHQFEWPGAVDGKVMAWFTDVAGVRCHVLLNIATGAIRIKDEQYNVLQDLAGGSYLIADSMSDIRATTVGNEFFLANVKKAPTPVYPGTANRNPFKGFAYITAGAFGKLFSITVNGYTSAGVQTHTFTGSYTTPSGTGGTDSANSTPEAIATNLETSLNAAAVTAGVSASYIITRQNAYIFIEWTPTSGTTASITVSVNSGTAYMIGSKGGVVNSSGELPAQLPAVANGYTVRVGTGNTPQYFQFKSGTTEWVEAASPGSPTGISMVPISLYYNGTAFALETANFEGRTSGDDKSNKLHEFMQFGITGMGTYQGRLVLLSGPLASLSASNEPRRFFRSTVTSIIPSDPIETGSSLNSSASYEYALSFQKDLLLFSKSYQAVLPSGNAAITPATATVVPTSAYEVDTLCSPVNLGRTLMFPAPRSAEFFGAMEMVPSTYTDSQYVSQEATPHLPKYMAGRCRFAVASSVSNVAVFGPTGDRRSLIVYEWAWSGDDKVQQSWHTWTLPYDISTAYFASERIVVMMVQNGVVVSCEIDTKAGTVTSDATRKPYLDMYLPIEIEDNAGELPDWMLTFDPDIYTKLRLVAGSGPQAGEFAGATFNSDGTIETVLSHPEGMYSAGIPFRSSFSPTPPVIRDYNEVAIQTTKATVLRYYVGTRNSTFYKVRVSDLYTTDIAEYEYSPLRYSSPELEPGEALVAARTINIVPARTDMPSTLLEIFTEGSGELNLTSLEYIAKYNQKIRRR